MRCSPSGLWGVAAGVAAAALVTTTAARAETPPIHVEYQAHVACPGVPVLLDEITRRTRLARFAGPSEPALEVEARITARRGESRGHLEIGAGRHRIVREIASYGRRERGEQQLRQRDGWSGMRACRRRQFMH